MDHFFERIIKCVNAVQQRWIDPPSRFGAKDELILRERQVGRVTQQSHGEAAHHL